MFDWYANKAAIQSAADNLDFAEVDRLLADREAAIEADLKQTRGLRAANNALRGHSKEAIHD